MISVAEIEASNWLLLRNVVGLSTVFHRTTEVETKPLPFTVKLNAGAPAVTVAGEMELIAGTGFEEPVTVKVKALDVAL